MANERNALAELAIRLGTDVLALGADKYPEIEAAQRIVAELAKIQCHEGTIDPWAEDAVWAARRCIAIAMEGVCHVGLRQ